MSVQHRPDTQQKPRRTLDQEALSLLATLLFAAVLIVLLQAFVFQLVRVDGSSMSNTLQSGEMMLVTKWDRDFQRGDIVVCHYPDRTEGQVNLGAGLALTRHTVSVKRLVALPRDTVEIRSGHLYVNGEAVPDPKEQGSEPMSFEKITLGEDEYFVMGDNRFSSHDSRSDDVGPLSKSMLRGKVRCVLWPLNRIRGVR